MNRRICVFCGAFPGLKVAYRQAAEELGRLLAKSSIGLVYGGGRVGLMGTLADAVLEAGGEAIGVIPQSLFQRELGHQSIKDLRIVGSMHERKALMEELSDGFIALPGGFGTLEELFEMITWLQLGVHGKPCGLLNIEGYYDTLLQFLDNVSSEGFLTNTDRQLLLADSNPKTLLDLVLSFKPPPTTKWLALEQT